MAEREAEELLRAEDPALTEDPEERVDPAVEDEPVRTPLLTTDVLLSVLLTEELRVDEDWPGFTVEDGDVPLLTVVPDREPALLTPEVDTAAPEATLETPPRRTDEEEVREMPLSRMPLSNAWEGPPLPKR